MRITKGMKLRPSENGHILSTYVPETARTHEINLSADFGPDELYNAVQDLQSLVNKATPAG